MSDAPNRPRECERPQRPPLPLLPSHHYCVTHSTSRTACQAGARRMDASILKGLNDKLYDKRKASALEVEK